MMYTITHNAQYNSVEITFDGKPSEKIREALKALRFRWHRALGVWYGYTDEQTARQAIDAAENGEAPEETPAKAPAQVQNRRKAKKPVIASLWDRCDVSALPGYGTDNEIKKAVRAEANAAGGSYDKHVAAYIRKHLKERFPECKFSVTSGGAGWLNNVDVTVKAGPYGRRFVKGNGDWNSRDQYDHWENSDELAAVLRYCEKLFDSFDDDDGDIYADYGAHHDLYGGASVSSDYTQTQATPEQIASAADFAERKAQAEAEQKAREAAEMAEREKQMELDRIEAARLEEIRKQQEAEIVEHVRIEDLPESEQIALVGALECPVKVDNLEEATQYIEAAKAEGEELRTDAVISRKVHFADRRVYENFCRMLMDDFDFLAGMGGTDTQDVRVTSENFQQLNAEQRESVRFYLCKCVGIYLDGVLMFAVDPEGFSYARYTIHADESTEQRSASEVLKEWRQESEKAAGFYIPAPVSEQIEKAELSIGEQITLVTLDPWTMAAGAVAGTLNSASPKQYAQHADAVEITYTPAGKRKPERVYIYKGKEALLYRGALPDVPASIKYTDCGGNLQRVNFAGEGAKDFLREVIKHYASLGFAPVVDTIQR